MAYIGFQQVAATNAVKTVADLTVPAKATWAELQADTKNVRYTMDGSTNPTQSSGMILLITQPPLFVRIDDVRKMKWIRGDASDGVLNVHFGAGRDV